MRRMKSTTSATMEPQPIYQHQPSQVSSILAKAIITGLSLPVGWWTLVYIFGEWGARNPSQTAATFILALVALALVGVAVRIIAVPILKDIITIFFEHRLELQEAINEGKRVEQLAAQTAPAGRALGDDTRFVNLVLLVMWLAYDKADEAGNVSGGKPWAWRNCESLVLAGETKKVGETMARRVRPFLEQRRIIIDDRIEVKRYPQLAQVNQLLWRLYNIPVAVNAAPTEEAGETYSIIET